MKNLIHEREVTTHPDSGYPMIFGILVAEPGGIPLMEWNGSQWVDTCFESESSYIMEGRLTEGANVI